MKILTAVTLSFGGHVAAFPMMDALTAPIVEGAFSGLDTRQIAAGPQGNGFGPLVPPPFDALAQRVSTKYPNDFRAPGPKDERGECPGLNALANHGYLPRNGRATIQQFIDATNKGFGMARDLGTFLAVYGALVDGDGTSWSIGGLPRTGILGSHNNYETDSSPLKSDLNQYGSNTKLIMGQFRNLYNRQPATNANYNLDILRDFRKSRFDESIAKNPYYTYLPFTGILVSQAAFTFIYRFMANKSAEAPEGILNRQVLKSFMSIQGEGDSMRWVPGHERFPENWYKRNQADEYGGVYFATDVLAFASKYPDIASVGCNRGRVNSYTAIDPSVLTGGAFTSQTAAANPICYGAQFALASYAQTSGISATKLTRLTNALNSAGVLTGCPTISNANLTALRSACPGFMGFYGGPTGPVAPGAIQS